MSQRDELARLVYTHGLNGTPNSVADAILAAGYIKADSEEWAVKGDKPEPWIQDELIINDRKYAEKTAEDYWGGRFGYADHTARVIRRVVGPWEVA